MIGFIIAAVLGIIGWIIAPDVLGWLAETVPAFQGNALPLAISRPIFTALLIILALILFGLIAALMRPRNSRTVNEAMMERERDALRRRQKIARAEARKGRGRNS